MFAGLSGTKKILAKVLDYVCAQIARTMSRDSVRYRFLVLVVVYGLE